MNKLFAAASLSLGLIVSGAPAVAAVSAHGAGASAIVTGEGEAWNDHGRRGWRNDRYNGNDRYDGGGRYNRGDNYYRGDSYYGRDGYYRSNQRASYDGPQYWRGDDGRNYCRRADGTTGLVVGAVIGGVLGSEMAGRRGDRTLGTILGGAAGALLGREVDRGGSRCR